MNEPALLWPWPWWTAVIAIVSIPLVSWFGILALLSPYNRRTRRITRQLRAAGFSSDDAFAISGDLNALVVSGKRLAMVDIRDSRVLQLMSLEDLTGLKIYQTRADAIPFRLMGRNGAQTRKVITQSVVEFTRLFALMADTSKKIEYIEE
jgi:hypothetical protein